MSASESNALDAIAFQLVAALEQYDVDVGRMVAAWPDLDAYRAVSEQIETIRMYSSTLPEVRVQWVEVLISHAQLIHHLWRMQWAPPGRPNAQVAGIRERHADCVAALRKRCLRVIATSSQRRMGVS